MILFLTLLACDGQSTDNVAPQVEAVAIDCADIGMMRPIDVGNPTSIEAWECNDVSGSLQCKAHGGAWTLSEHGVTLTNCVGVGDGWVELRWW